MEKREVRVGKVSVGGKNPVSVQSMTNTDTRDANATIAQILRLEEAGCEIVRVAVPDNEAAEAVAKKMCIRDRLCMVILTASSIWVWRLHISRCLLRQEFWWYRLRVV